MQITTNIITTNYEIKLAKFNGIGTSLRIGFTGEWVGKEVLLIPILDDDLIQMHKRKDGTFLINVCSLEIMKKVVVEQHKGKPDKGGRCYIPTEYVGCNVLIVPLE